MVVNFATGFCVVLNDSNKTAIDLSKYNAEVQLALVWFNWVQLQGHFKCYAYNCLYIDYFNLNVAAINCLAARPSLGKPKRSFTLVFFKVTNTTTNPPFYTQTITYFNNKGIGGLWNLKISCRPEFTDTFTFDDDFAFIALENTYYIYAK